MPATVSGLKNKVIPQAQERGSMDRTGLWTWVVTQIIPKEIFPNGLKSRYSKHPRFTTMELSRIDVKTTGAGKFYEVDYYYEGYIKPESQNEGFSNEGLPESSYTLSLSLGQEPIETHPKFSSFAGTPSNPKNGAVFIDPETGKPTKDNDKGIFKEFAFKSGSKNTFAGVDSFLSPGATFTETTYSRSGTLSVGPIGTISSPPGGGATGGRNWLFSGTETSRRGHLYEVRKTWILSGPNGWNKEIYS